MVTLPETIGNVTKTPLVMLPKRPGETLGNVTGKMFIVVFFSIGGNGQDFLVTLPETHFYYMYE